MHSVTRRSFLTSASAAAISWTALPSAAQEGYDASVKRYDLPEEYLPRLVKLRTPLTPGEIHVDPAQFALFWTLPDNEAFRYTVGIGRPGLYEAGEFFVGAKKQWPSWTPTPDMIERQPELYAKYEDGMPGGPENPLGARALYLFTPERGDTFLRIHGTNDPATIARQVSNGCARLVNEHIIHLYARVPLDTRVVLYPNGY